ncbi:MAG: DUF4830 domain-containing protein [Clostridiales bacterium]|nr:DUF4830 domain-containing protein [Candidatus Equinaster intestinalis]
MGFVCVKVKSRKTFCLLLLLILFLIISSEFTSCFSDRGNTAETQNQRYEFLRKFGITVESETKTEGIIPEKFSADFTAYNNMQFLAGYDLSDFRGRKVSIFEYPWKNDGKEYSVHLIVYEREIIGGDISENRLNGEILPLKEI